VKVEPPRRPRWKPVALITPGQGTVTVRTAVDQYRASNRTDAYDLLSRFADHQCYVGGQLTALRHTTGATCWQASTWKGRATAMALDGTKLTVSSLRGALADEPDPWSALVTVLNALAAFGVAPGTITSMAWNLWRASLPGPIELYAPPEVTRPSFFGGRQWSREAKTYKHQVAVDITAAYPHSMGARPYALGLREVDPRTTIDPTRAGLARARVLVPLDAAHPPLPLRVDRDAITFPYGLIEGTWPWVELAAAQALGYDVKVSKCWAPTRETDLFSRWWIMAQALRALPVGAGLAKAILNSTWGLFAMRPDDRRTVRWEDEAGRRSVAVTIATRPLPHEGTVHVAAETSARLRARLLTEGLSRATSTIHADTDGLIVRRSGDLPRLGEQLGDWRVKSDMREVQLRAPQVYRWSCHNGCGVVHPRWHYVCAGVPGPVAADYFAKVPPHAVRASVRGMEMVLAPIHVADRGAIAKALGDARALSSELFGQPLGVRLSLGRR
jgi:hypothetical protein